MPRNIKYRPYATNRLPSDYLFYQRKHYNTSPTIYPSGEDLSKPLNIWYDKPLFGKVDLSQRYVFPNPSTLRHIGNGQKAINFVSDAYADFVYFIGKASRRLQTCMTSIIQYDNPKKAYESLPTAYHTYFVNLDQMFLNVYLSAKQKNDIIGFPDYMRQYMAYSRTNSSFPQTLVGYLASNRTSNRVGGLIIEFANSVPYDHDGHKWDKYLSSDYFSDYIQIAANFGFYVDKNIPWSIAANMNSKAMKDYMNRYNIKGIDHNFSANYLQAEYISYISFKKYMFSSYQTFILSKPRVEQYGYCNRINDSTISSAYKTIRVIHERPTEFGWITGVTYENFLKKYPECFFLDKYIRIRLTESGISLPRKRIENIIKKVVYRYTSKGLYSATILLSELMVFYGKTKYDLLTSNKKSGNISNNNSYPTLPGNTTGY